MTTTKEQERKALEKIKALVEQLGPDSYLATAFEGCFEIAAENIENDWACSMKQQRDSEAKRAAELELKVGDLQKQLKKAELNERDLREAIKKAKEDASHTITALRQQILSGEDTETLIITLENDIDSEESWQQQAAATISLTTMS